MLVRDKSGECLSKQIDATKHSWLWNSSFEILCNIRWNCTRTTRIQMLVGTWNASTFALLRLQIVYSDIKLQRRKLYACAWRSIAAVYRTIGYRLHSVTPLSSRRWFFSRPNRQKYVKVKRNMCTAIPSFHRHIALKIHISCAHRSHFMYVMMAFSTPRLTSNTTFTTNGARVFGIDKVGIKYMTQRNCPRPYC